jgi:hypothetical protein
LRNRNRDHSRCNLARTLSNSYCFTGNEYVQLEDEIFAWAEKHYCGSSLEDRNGQEVYIWAYVEDQPRVETLRPEDTSSILGTCIQG